jgi:hypothetical protein
VFARPPLRRTGLTPPANRSVSLYLTGVGVPGFVLALALVNAANTGHTKKTTANAIFLIGYCLGNLLAPLSE